MITSVNFQLAGCQYYTYMHMSTVYIYTYVYTHICVHMYACIQNTGAWLIKKYFRFLRIQFTCMFYHFQNYSENTSLVNDLQNEKEHLAETLKKETEKKQTLSSLLAIKEEELHEKLKELRQLQEEIKWYVIF